MAGVDLKALKTLPPRPYTQGELVKAMKSVAKLVSDPRLKQKLKDSVGIGTEATRANIIGGLLNRGYLIKKGRAIRASDAAFTLTNEGPQVTVESAVATLRANPRLILSGLGARLLFGVLLVSLQFFLFQSLKSELGVSKADLTLVYDALAPLRGEGLGSL